MPETLRVLLSSLPDYAAEEVWKYLDSDADAVHDMIDCIRETHAEVEHRLCNGE